MEQLEIHANRKAANGGFWFFSALIPFLSFPLLILIIGLPSALLSVDVERIGVSILGVGVFGWLIAALGAYWLQFRRIRTLDGPLLVLSPAGLTDHWRKPSVFVAWQDVEQAEWRAAPGLGGILQFTVRSRPWLERVIGTLGFRPFNYPSVYMDHDLTEIGAFIDRYYPPTD